MYRRYRTPMPLRTVLAWIVAVTFLLMFVQSTTATTPLESLVAGHTGIARNVSPALQAVAATRASQIIGTDADPGANFSHALMTTPEILAFVTTGGYGDDFTWALNAWHASTSGHESMMHDRNYTDIGCAAAYGAGSTYMVCAFGPWYWPAKPAPAPATTAPAPQVAAPPAEDEPGWNCQTMGNKVCGPVVLPDTAMGTP